MEYLKQLFGSKIDEEIKLDETVINPGENKDETSKEEQPADDKKPDTSKLETEKGEKEGETPENEGDQDNKKGDAVDNGGENMALFENGWYNSESGEVDESKIKNPEVLEAIKTLTGRYQAERNQQVILNSLNDELKNYSLTVSTDTLRKVLDLSNVKMDKEGKPTGIKEAIESLKTSEPGFFKDKEKESNPLNEGFNPVEKKTVLSEDELISMAYGQEN
jgi:hypothetical protein